MSSFFSTDSMSVSYVALQVLCLVIILQDKNCTYTQCEHKIYV